MNVEPLLSALFDLGGSDLHLKVGSPPLVRAHGQLLPLDLPALYADDTRDIAGQLLPPDRFERLEREGDAEIATSFAGLGRYRINFYSQRQVIGGVFRLVASRIPTVADLGLPTLIDTLAEERRGLILVTGPAGTGKTTTIAAMIGHINRTRRCHIITLEDPIEALHADELASIDQREIGIDTPTYGTGLRYALRQDPDVLFIGEIRDQEAAEAALNAAETGHLVISTMHTIDAAETLNRYLEMFDAERQRQVRMSLAGSLRAVISQRLVPRADGRGRLPSVEIMVVNGRVADLIVDPLRPGASLAQIMEEGGSYGMQTFDQALIELVRQGMVSIDDARVASSSPHDFGLALANAQLA